MGQFKEILREQLQPIQNDIRLIKLHGVSQADFKNTVDPIKHDVATLSARLDALENKSSGLPSARSGQSTTTDIETKLLELEHKLSELAHRDREANAVIGGLGNFEDIDEAVTFLKEQFDRLKTPEYADIFTKGDFNNIVFIKFRSAASRDQFVSVFGKAQIKHQGNAVWTRPDLPIEKRVPESFLFGLRKVFLEWKYTKEEIRVDTHNHIFKVASEPVVQATISNDQLKLHWYGAWGTWDDLTNSSELQHLVSRANETLSRVGKGSGKGKKGGEKGGH